MPKKFSIVPPLQPDENEENITLLPAKCPNCTFVGDVEDVDPDGEEVVGSLGDTIKCPECSSEFTFSSDTEHDITR